MKNSPITKEAVVRFFADNKITGSRSQAKEFIRKFGLTKDGFTEFKQLAGALNTKEINPGKEDNIFSRLETFSRFRKFLAEVEDALDIETPDYDSMITVRLHKQVNPPLEAYNFVGHNKLDIKENTCAGAYLYQ